MSNLGTTPAPHFISRKTVDKSYRPKSWVMSPGLQRARRPFLVKNTLLGLGLFAFCTSVWAYSISAVRQDTFEDLDEEARALAASGVAVKSIEDEERERNAQTITSSVSSAQPAAVGTGTTVASLIVRSETQPPTSAIGGRGLFPHRALVWGAPPVDRLGRMSDKSTSNLKL